MCPGEQVVYWEDDTKPDTVGKVRITGNYTAVNVSGLQGNTQYYLAVCAFNTAGTGPQSIPVNVTTKKPRKYSGHCKPSLQNIPRLYVADMFI